MLSLPDTTFPRGSENDLREELAGASQCSGTLSSTRFSVNSSNHSGRSRNGFLRTPSLSSFLFGFLISAGARDGSPRTLSMPLVLSLLVDAGCCVGITAAELEEPAERPRTTVDT